MVNVNCSEMLRPQPSVTFPYVTLTTFAFILQNSIAESKYLNNLLHPTYIPIYTHSYPMNLNSRRELNYTELPTTEGKQT
jgi:hypothetical protein